MTHENLSRHALVASAAASESNNKCSALDAAGRPEADAEMGLLSEVDQDAAGALTDIRPATRKGPIARLQYVADLEGRGDERDFEDKATKPTEKQNICPILSKASWRFFQKLHWSKQTAQGDASQLAF
jgi:hypothetical protein